MSPEEIQYECEKAYSEIAIQEGRLKWLREICKHENTFAGLYSPRHGAEYNALICTNCLTPLKSLEPPLC